MSLEAPRSCHSHARLSRFVSACVCVATFFPFSTRRDTFALWDTWLVIRHRATSFSASAVCLDAPISLGSGHRRPYRRRRRGEPMLIQRENLCDDERTGNHGLDVLRSEVPSGRAGGALFSSALAKVNPSLFPRGVYLARPRRYTPATLFTAESMLTEIGNKLFIAQLAAATLS